MKRTKYLIPIVFLILAIKGCFGDSEINPSKVLEIENHSNDVILFQFGNRFPDTLLWEENPFSEQNIDKSSIEPGKSVEIPFFNSVASDPNQKTCLFFLDKVTVVNSDWNSIRDNYEILDRFDFTEQYLARLNWHLVFPIKE